MPQDKKPQRGQARMDGPPDRPAIDIYKPAEYGLDIAAPGFEFDQSPFQLKEKKKAGYEPLKPTVYDPRARQRDETPLEYRTRRAVETRKAAIESGPRESKKVSVAQFGFEPGLNPNQSPIYLDRSDEFAMRDAGPAWQPGETAETFERRKRLDREAAQAKANAEIGFYADPIKKPSVSELYLKGEGKIFNLDATVDDAQEGLKDVTDALVMPFTQGMTEPLRQAGVGLRALGGEGLLGATQDQLMPRGGIDYLDPRLSPDKKVEGLGAQVIEGLGSMTGFIGASTLGGGPAVGALGALSNAGSTFEEALQKGATREQAIIASVPAAIIGSLEAWGGIGRGVETFIKGGIKMALLEEGTQGAWSQALNNINARILSGYDPDRAIAEGVLESGLLEGLTGAALPAGIKFGEMAQGALRGLKNLDWRQKLVDWDVAQYEDTKYRRMLSPAERSMFGMIPIRPGTDGQPASYVKWYYSNLGRVVNEKFPPKMTPQQATAMLTDPKRGIKKEEYEWSGLADLIKEKEAKGEQVTKAELIEKIKENEVELEEVILGQDENQSVDFAAEQARLSVEADALRASIQRELGRPMDSPLTPGSKDWELISPELRAKFDELNSKASQLLSQQVDQSFKDSGEKTQYESMKVLRGGEKGSYRELLLKLPDAGSPILQELDDVGQELSSITKQFLESPTPELQAQMQALKDKKNALETQFENTPEAFESSHFRKNGRGLLAHIRLDIGKNAEGKRILRIQEIQSDQHQQGREIGYKNDRRIKDLRNQMAGIDSELDELSGPMESIQYQSESALDPDQLKIKARWEELMDLRSDLNSGMMVEQQKIPDAPFKNSWHELAMKRVLRMAAEEGIDQIVWPLGTDQAEFWKDYTETGDVHKLLYDQKIPQFARDLAKKYKTDTGRLTLPPVVTAYKVVERNYLGSPYAIVDDDGNIVAAFDTKKEAEAGLARTPSTTSAGQEVYYLNIPQELTRTALFEGFKTFANPMFDIGGILDFVKGLKGDQKIKVNNAISMRQMGGEKPYVTPNADGSVTVGGDRPETYPVTYDSKGRVVEDSKKAAYEDVPTESTPADGRIFEDRVQPEISAPAKPLSAKQEMTRRRILGQAATLSGFYGEPVITVLPSGNFQLSGDPGSTTAIYDKNGRMIDVFQEPIAMKQLSLETKAEMEAKAQALGYPLALTPETQEAYGAQQKAIQRQMLMLDPSSPEFEALQTDYIKLATAIMDGEAFSTATTWAELENMLQERALRSGDQQGIETDLIQVLKPGMTEESGQIEIDEAGPYFEPILELPPGNTKKTGVLFVHPDFMTALGYEGINGLNIPMQNVDSDVQKLQANLPPDKARQAVNMYNKALMDSVRRGITTITVVRLRPDIADHALWTTIRHESFHAAQMEGARRTVGYREGTYWSLTNAEWFDNHPVVQKAMYSDFWKKLMDPAQQAGASPDLLKMIMRAEFPTYLAAGQGFAFDISEEEASRFLLSYFGDIADTHGAEALTAFADVAHLRESVEGYIANARKFAKKQTIDWGRAGRGNNEGPSGSGPPAARSVSPDVEGPSSPGADDSGDTKATSPDSGGVGQGESTAIVPYAAERADTLTEEEVRALFGMDPAEPFDAAIEAGAVIDAGDGRYEVVGEAGTQEPPPPPPIPPKWPDEWSDPDKPEDFTEPVIKSDILAGLVDEFTDLLNEGGVAYNPDIPPSQQIYAALRKKKISSADVASIVSRAGMTLTKFIDMVEDAYSKAGKDLQRLSVLDGKWSIDFKDTVVKPERKPAQRKGETKAQARKRAAEEARTASEEKVRDVFRTTPVKTVLTAAFRDIERGRLGKSMNKRMSDRLRKLILSDQTITAYNIVTTHGQIPLRVARDGLAAWGLAMAKGDGKWSERMKEAAEDRNQAIQGGIDVLRNLKPKNLKELWKNGWQDGFYATNDVISVMDQLKESFPDIYTKIHGPESGIEKSGNLPLFMTLMQSAIDDRVTDPKLKAKYQAQMKVLKKRYDRDHTLAGKAVEGIDWGLDVMVRPNSMQEYYSRGTYFVGNLRGQLAMKGYDMAQMIKDGTFKDIPKPALQDSLDEALSFTYAYDPKYQGNWIEGSAARIIGAFNYAGLPGTLIEPFGKAIYNGMKFMYEFGPLAAMKPLSRLATKEGREGFNFYDARQLSGAFVGTVMYATAYQIIKAGLMGDEWWQLKTGRKRKDGTPIYLDIRRYQPMSTFMWMVDATNRAITGRVGKLELASEFGERVAGMRKAGDDVLSAGMESINLMFQMWSGNESESKQIKLEQAMGRQLAIPLTPLVNLRNLLGQFDDQEKVRRDTREMGIWGPSLDKIPWLRQRMPEVEMPAQAPPVNISEDPALSMLGATFRSGQNFAGREWARMGYRPSVFLKSFSDPVMDRAAKQYFYEVLDEFSKDYEKDPDYQKLTDRQKMEEWEKLMLGEYGIPAQARKAGMLANPDKALEIQMKEKVPQFRRKAIEEEDPNFFKGK